MAFAWLTSGLDVYAADLLEQVLSSGIRISIVICDRDPATNPHVARLAVSCRGANVSFEVVPAKEVDSDLRREAQSEWQRRFDMRIAELISRYDCQGIVLAGYMRIVTSSIYERWPLTLNLHPAPPLGPVGAWKDVIWSLIAVQARTAGAMLHITTEQMDRGPVVSYYTVSIDDSSFSSLWTRLRDDLLTASVVELRNQSGGARALFDAIRAKQFVRESPLLILTLQLLQDGHLFYDRDKSIPLLRSVPSPGGVCLTSEVDSFVAQQQGICASAWRHT